MKTFLFLAPLFVYALAAPVQKKGNKQAKESEDMALHLAEYNRYVKQVLDVLEDDPNIRERIRTATDAELADGKLSEEIARLAPHHIRSQLDEAKRQTIQRQRIILRRRMEMEEGARQRVDTHDDDLLGGDIPKFDAGDIKQVMLTRLDELKKEDKERRDQFVKLEMEKEHQRRVALKKMNEKDRLEAEEKHKFLQEKKKEHPPMHHPGSEAQLKEVWKEEDGLDEQDFDPKTFFELHDTNGDGYLDTFELEALFIHEVSKVYDGDENDSPEMHEELARMREHVFEEVDKDQDALISFEEFQSSTELTSFGEDPGWKGLEEEIIYTDEEMDEYERMLQEEMEALDNESQDLIEKERLEAEKAMKHEEEKPPAVQEGENAAAAHQETKENDNQVEMKKESSEEEKKVEEERKEEKKEEEKKVEEESKEHVEAKQEEPVADGGNEKERQEGGAENADRKDGEKIEQAQGDAGKTAA